jgi:DNA polymerase-3 subunit alpha
MNNFAHLHTHSYYSLLDGLSSPKDLIKKAKENKQPALALTDHGNMHGAVEFYIEAKKAEIKPLIGCEFYLANRTMNDRESIDRQSKHLILIAKNKNGYENLSHLVTESYINGFYYKPIT